MVIPAPLSKMSYVRLRLDLTDDVLDHVGIGDIEHGGHSLAVTAIAGGGSCLGGIEIQIGNGNLGAEIGHGAGNSAGEPASAANDERHLAGEIEHIGERAWWIGKGQARSGGRGFGIATGGVSPGRTRRSRRLASSSLTGHPHLSNRCAARSAAAATLYSMSRPERSR